MKTFKPGKLNERQRNFIVMASELFYGTPRNFCTIHVSDTSEASYRGLLKRGIMEEYKTGFAKLTPNGWKVACAIHRLCGRDREADAIEAWSKEHG